jgi:hypothetical protein
MPVFQVLMDLGGPEMSVTVNCLQRRMVKVAVLALVVHWKPCRAIGRDISIGWCWQTRTNTWDMGHAGSLKDVKHHFINC